MSRIPTEDPYQNRQAKEPQPPAAQRMDHTRSCSALSLDSDFIAGQCTCGLEYRIALQSEQTMHAAWRKRAEEAENRLKDWEALALSAEAGLVNMGAALTDAQNCEEKLEAELAALKAADGWISCAERLPKSGDGEYVDVVIKEVVQDSPAYLDIGEDGIYRWYWTNPDADPAPFEKVSHWRERPAFARRPLPSPPAKPFTTEVKS